MFLNTLQCTDLRNVLNNTFFDGSFVEMQTSVGPSEGPPEGPPVGPLAISVAETANRAESGELKLWSEPSEILDLRYSNTPENVAFTIP